MRSLAITEEQLGADHPSIASSLYNLAVLYHQTERSATALTLIQRAIQIYEHAIGVEHLTIAVFS